MERQSYKNFITKKYGDNIFNCITEFQTAYKNTELLNIDIHFLSKCKRSGIVPIHCRIGGRRSASPTTKKMIGKTEKKLLNRSIVKNYSKRWKQNQIREKRESVLDEKLSLSDYMKLTELTEKRQSRKLERKTKQLANKFENLLKTKFKEKPQISIEEKKIYQEKTLLNFSQIDIPEEFIPLLSKGLEFKVSTKKLPFIDRVCGIEEAVKSFTSPAMANEF